MSNGNVYDEFIEEVNGFCRNNPGKKIDHVEMGVCKAWDFVGLGSDIVGSLAEQTFKKGIEALEENGINGIKIKIDRENPDAPIKAK